MRLSNADLKELWNSCVDDTLEQLDLNMHQVKQVRKHGKAFQLAHIDKVDAVSIGADQTVPQPDAKQIGMLKRKLNQVEGELEQTRAECLEKTEERTKRRLEQRYPAEMLQFEPVSRTAPPEATSSSSTKEHFVYKDEEIVGQAQNVVKRLKELPGQLADALEKTNNWLETGPLSESTIIQ